MNRRLLVTCSPCGSCDTRHNLFLAMKLSTRFHSSPSKARITDQSNSGNPSENFHEPPYPKGAANPPAKGQRIWWGATQWEHAPTRRYQIALPPSSLRYRCKNSSLSTAKTSFHSFGSSCAVSWSATNSRGIVIVTFFRWRDLVDGATVKAVLTKGCSHARCPSGKRTSPYFDTSIPPPTRKMVRLLRLKNLGLRSR
jgi:hypothetical protein